MENSNSDAFNDAVLTPEIIKSRIREEIVFIAEIDGKIVGTVSGMGERKSFCVKTLAVHLYHRNKGIGERLMIEVERYAREKDCNKLWLTVVPAMEKAIYLYKKLKYEKEGYLRKHFCRMDLILMGKLL